MESFTDPESLRRREDVEFVEEAEILDKGEFESSREELENLGPSRRNRRY